MCIHVAALFKLFELHGHHQPDLHGAVSW